jgi:hypothetical protein
MDYLVCIVFMSFWRYWEMVDNLNQGWYCCWDSDENEKNETLEEEEEES